MELKTFIKTAAVGSTLYIGAIFTSVCFATDAYAAPKLSPIAVSASIIASSEAPRNFERKSFGIQGQWSILQKNGQTILRLSDDFKTKRGPDLKIFLSPKTIDSATGNNATRGSVKIGELKSNRGGQDYIIPAHINLTDYQSVLIHCEAFSKLWGGSNLT